MVDGWDGVADGGRRGFAAGGEVVLAPTEYEWGIGRVGRGGGGPCFGLGRACFWLYGTEEGPRLFEIWGKYKLCPPLKFRAYCGSVVGW